MEVPPCAAKVIVLLLLAILSWSVPDVQATSWDTHYLVTPTITPSGVNHYLFEYAVTNLDQGAGAPQGLDGFYIQVPLTATLIGITDPATYSSGGSWDHQFLASTPDLSGANATLQPGYQWLAWWGNWPASVYPIGTTATFSVELANVSVGSNDGVTVTYWGAYSYTGYEGPLQGPVTATPLPSSFILMATAMVALPWGRRLFRS